MTRAGIRVVNVSLRRVVKGSHTQHHTQRGAPDLADDFFFNGKPGTSPVQVFESRKGLLDVLDGPGRIL